MSTSEANKNYKLNVKIDNEFMYLVKISVFNSENRIITAKQKSSDQYIYNLTKGIYTIRIVMNGEIKDEYITITADTEYKISSKIYDKNVIEPPKQYSSALLQGEFVRTYDSSHEYYTYPAIDISQKDTFKYQDIATNESYNSSLFIFMRYPSYEKYKELQNKKSLSFYQNFEILNEYGERIIHFDARIGIEIDENFGWVAFNAKLPNGIYYLLYHGEEPRQIPIYVFKEWHTQFFMTLGEKPLFGSIRIFIAKNRVFAPHEATHRYIDILLDKLQNNDYSVDKNLIEIAALGKFDSPMLGLICSYLYFKTPTKQHHHLFNVIANNMQHVILKDNEESPDLRALEILAVEHFEKKDFNKTPVKGTPMLRIGFEAIQHAALEYKDLIPTYSVNDFISESLYYDSPFNSFKPIPFYIKKDEHTGNKITVDNNFPTPEFQTKALDLDKLSMDTSAMLKFENLSKSISNYVNEEKITPKIIMDFENQTDNNWVKSSIVDILSTDANLSLKGISKKLNLSENTLGRVIQNWDKNEINMNKSSFNDTNDQI